MTRFLGLLILMLLTSPVEARAQSQQLVVTVALPEGPPTRTVGLLLAKERGYFTAAGLDVTFTTAGYGSSPIDILTDKRADLAVEIMPIALSRRERGSDVVHVAQFFQKATLELACHAVIDQPAKLAGHNVGVWFDGWESSFYAWLSRLGISYFAAGGGVTLVRQGMDAEIFLENEVDCLTTTTYRVPLLLASLGAERQTLVTYRYQDLDMGVLEDGLYVRGADLKDPARLALFKRFFKAAARGWQEVVEDPAEAQQLILSKPDFAKLDPAALTESLKAVAATVAPETGEIGALDEAAYDHTVLLLMTGAPDPLLKAAPAGAVSPAVRQVP